jgi:hypothetical protein
MKQEHKEALNEIKTIVDRNGGYVSANRLVMDAIQIFISHYKDDAISKYSSAYNKK